MHKFFYLILSYITLFIITKYRNKIRKLCEVEYYPSSEGKENDFSYNLSLLYTY